MPNVVVVVIPELAPFQAVMDVWQQRGVSGVTALESMGLQKINEVRARRDDLPLFPSLRHLMESEGYRHRMAFTVVEDDFDLDGLIEATKVAVGGDFNAANSGILFVVPVSRALGLNPHWKSNSGS